MTEKTKTKLEWGAVISAIVLVLGIAFSLGMNRMELIHVKQESAENRSDIKEVKNLVAQELKAVRGELATESKETRKEMHEGFMHLSQVISESK